MFATVERASTCSPFRITTVSTTQKPIGKPRASRYVVSKDPRPEAGFFGDGGAGGLRSSSRPVSGAHGDVDKLTGMPYAVDLPPAKPLGADVAPALVLSRIIGLTGEFPGASAWGEFLFVF